MSGSASQSRGQNYNQQEQNSGSVATNWSEAQNSSNNRQGNQATSGQGVWGAQQGALTDLYGQSQGLMSGSNPYGQQANMLGQQGQNAWAQQLTPGQNPHFDQAVQASIDQATESFKRGTLADLDARSAGVGQLGSSRDRLATGEAAGLFGQSIAQTAAQQRAQQYSSDQDRALQAIGMTGNMQQSAYSPLSVAASLIGGPTVLSQAQSSGWGDASSTGLSRSASDARSFGYGAGWGTGRTRQDSASGGLKS
jgi:hypothetical protein